MDDPPQRPGSAPSPLHRLHPQSQSQNQSQSQLYQPRVRFAEEEPAPIPAPAHAHGLAYNPTPRLIPRPHEKPPVPAAAAAPAPVETVPDVYWADDRDNDNDNDNDNGTIGNGTLDNQNMAQYTFYREGTPTPPEYDLREKPPLGYGRGRDVSSTIASSSAAAGGTHSSGDFVPFGHPEHINNWITSSDQESPPRISKKKFWILVGVAVLLVTIIAVGVGVGLGIGMRPRGQQANNPPPQAVSSPSSSAITPTSPPTTKPESTTAGATSTSAGDSSSLVPTSTTGGAFVTSPPTQSSDCPGANNTVYNVPGSTKTFLRICGLDYSGTGATDIANVTTNSFAECMNQCALLSNCTACGWGFIAGDTGDAHRCWMKNDLKANHEATKDWSFAILQ
ncbi:hypothetical protein B0H63DRAFT_291845 [Podospora didyma]|uniref:Apple domain-containing protein n=1 Tax=Podospora didyma TaxID=330526 RepID=A0AAE0N7H8_9PEZI|nr:hypothetical protein B0H63DRAFT_291845 [Podospora didyma]